jgi:hypothetical protein
LEPSCCRQRSWGGQNKKRSFALQLATRSYSGSSGLVSGNWFRPRCGIEVPHTELIDIRDIRGLPTDADAMEGNALAVQRFDRGAKGRAVHMEDFAQVFGL